MDPKVPRTKASLSLAMMRFGVFMSLLTCTQVKCASVRHRHDAYCCSICCSCTAERPTSALLSA